VAGIGLLDHVHRQHPDRIDAEVINIFVHSSNLELAFSFEEKWFYGMVE
jgi:hypothetical protein